MRSDYKKLGDYIRIVDVRNTDRSITNLQGVSITKTFIPSIANMVGVDTASYKVVKTGQFAYGPVTSRNGDKCSIARLYGEDCIMSSSYVAFEDYKPDELDPDYLMMWFMRPEFDRYARFMSNGSAREVFDWESMCGVEIPVPSIEEQRKIVHDYKVVTDRIELLKKINENLEAQAQATYKAWFEDFEPFDGNMPTNWYETTIDDIAQEVVCGKTPSTDVAENYGGKTPFITIPDMHGSVYAVKTARMLSDLGVSTQANKTLPENSICVSCIATVGLVCLTAEPSQTNQQINSIVCKPDVSPFYIYLKMITLTDHLKALGGGGSTTLNVNKTLFGQINILYPDTETINRFHKIVEPMFSVMRNNQLEMENLASIQDLTLKHL